MVIPQQKAWRLWVKEALLVRVAFAMIGLAAWCEWRSRLAV